MDRGVVKPWDQLDDERRKQWSRRMEVFAAQTELLDRAIGRLLGAIQRLGVEQDTLVIFLSDNGGAAEDPNQGDPSATIGSRDSYPRLRPAVGDGEQYAVAATQGNRIRGGDQHAADRVLARWHPRRVSRDAGPRAGAHHRPAPDLPRAGGRDVSRSHRRREAGRPGHRREAQGRARPIRPARSAGSTRGHRAIRQGKWKLVTLASSKEGWELYDIEADRTESRDVAGEHPANRAPAVRRIRPLGGPLWRRCAGGYPARAIVVEGDGALTGRRRGTAPSGRSRGGVDGVISHSANPGGVT